MIGGYGSKCRGGRALLNAPPFHSTAAIVAEVEDTREWKDGHYSAMDQPLDPDPHAAKHELVPEVCFQISDCDRSIGFELDWIDEAGRANSLHKLDTLIDTLTEFRAAVIEEQRLYADRKAALPEAPDEDDGRG